MMNWRISFTIFRKELLETLRDRRTLIANYGVPLLVYPLVLFLSGQAIVKEVSLIQKEKIPVVILGNQPPGLLERVSQSKSIHAISLSKEDLSELESHLLPNKAQLLDYFKQKKIKAILVLNRLPSPKPDERRFQAKIYLDEMDRTSASVERILNQELLRAVVSLRDEKLHAKGVSENDSLPFQIIKESIRDPRRAMDQVLGSVAIYMILLLLCLAAFYPALNTTAGERELGTLSTLLGTPIDNGSLIFGKFLVVLFSAITGIGTYFFSTFFCSYMVFGKFHLPYGPNSPILFPAIVSMAACVISAITLCVGFLSRKKSEAQALLSLLMLVILAPAFVAVSTDIPLSWSTAGIPLLNIALMSKAIAVDPVPFQWVFLTLASNLLLTFGFLHFSTELIQSEYRADVSLSDLLSLERNLLREPTPSLSALVYTALLFASFYAHFFISNTSVFVSVPLVQILGFLGIPILFCRYYGFSVREVSFLNPPSLGSTLGAVLIGLGAPSVVAWIFPIDSVSKELAREFEKVLHIHDPQVSTLHLVTLVAVLPAICEEFAFRGMVFTGLRNRFSLQLSIPLSAIFFGINHFSMDRFFPTALLGGLLAWVAHRTQSIIPGMLVHGLYNTLLILALRHPDWQHGVMSNPWVGVSFLATGVLLIRTRSLQSQ